MAGEPGGAAGGPFVGGGGGHAEVASDLADGEPVGFGGEAVTFGGAGGQLAGEGHRSPPGSQMIVVLEVVILGGSGPYLGGVGVEASSAGDGGETVLVVGGES